jgi:hypothetical protein
MKTSVAVLGLRLSPSLLFAESIRCGSQLIEKGSTSADLLEYCGQPAQVVKNGTVDDIIANTHIPGWRHQPGRRRFSNRDLDLRFRPEPTHGTGSRRRGSDRFVGATAIISRERFLGMQAAQPNN